jgi:hypothetical protein
LDWFTPGIKPELDEYDLDLGSSGPILARDSGYLVGGGKEGVVYVVDPNALGHSGLPVQSFQGTALCGTFTLSGCQQIHFPAYWARRENRLDSGSPGSLLYVWGSNDNLRVYRYSDGAFDTSPAYAGNVIALYPGGNLTVSASEPRAQNAILWAVASSIVHAYDAANVANELWNSEQNGNRDSLGNTFGLALYTVANGKVYVPINNNTITVYGLLPSSAGKN